MVVKVCCYYRRIHIISRMLYGAELIYILVLWNYHKSSGMLSGRSLNTGTSLYQSVHFRIMQSNVMVFNIFFYISECRFIGKGSYGSCLEYVSLSEKDFRIRMGLLLIFSREVKVDIRLLVAVKSKECFKGYIVAVFFHHCSAFRAGLIRHIHS